MQDLTSSGSLPPPRARMVSRNLCPVSLTAYVKNIMINEHKQISFEKHSNHTRVQVKVIIGIQKHHITMFDTNNNKFKPFKKQFEFAGSSVHHQLRKMKLKAWEARFQRMDQNKSETTEREKLRNCLKFKPSIMDVIFY